MHTELMKCKANSSMSSRVACDLIDSRTLQLVAWNGRLMNEYAEFSTGDSATLEIVAWWIGFESHP